MIPDIIVSRQPAPGGRSPNEFDSSSDEETSENVTPFQVNWYVPIEFSEQLVYSEKSDGMLARISDLSVPNLIFLKYCIPPSRSW